jgi:hypothetical protein
MRSLQQAGHRGSCYGDALCAAIDDAEQDIGALADVDVLAEGTDAVGASLTTLRETTPRSKSWPLTPPRR